ncbi:DUF397 domain-containing protein [Actinoallomurus sp. NPDC050550]|uniref:DUF397 domain-containing protein n=1 Tax=Actinoallomurus sp. NPDC050550 TaxID=3154937 RepID=UPI0033ECAF41
MTDRNRPQAVFRKSTFSDAGEGCVEAAMLHTLRLVRDSKDPNGPTLAFTSSAWAAFIDDIKQGKLDLTGSLGA